MRFWGLGETAKGTWNHCFNQLSAKKVWKNQASHTFYGIDCTFRERERGGKDWGSKHKESNKNDKTETIVSVRTGLKGMGENLKARLKWDIGTMREVYQNERKKNQEKGISTYWGPGKKRETRKGRKFRGGMRQEGLCTKGVKDKGWFLQDCFTDFRQNAIKEGKNQTRREEEKVVLL